MECGIYSIKLNGDVLYVGQSCNIPKRWKFHKWQLGKGIHPNSYLQRVYNKYLDLEFCVEEFVTDRRSLTKRERYYMNELKPKCNFILPDENDSWIFSEERNQKVSIGNLGKPKSAEHRRNISISKMGDRNPQYGKKPWNFGLSNYMSGSKNHFYGKTHSEITRKLISDMNRKTVDVEMIVELRDSGLSFEKIGDILGVSRRTISRRYYEYKQISDKNSNQ